MAIDRLGLAESALPVVTSLARRTLSDVVVLAVRDLHADLEPPEATTARVHAVVRRLVAAGVNAHGQVRSTYAAYARSVARVIADAASEMHADLLALGSHGRSDPLGLLLGSVGHQVAAMVDCPVLLVSGAGHPPAREIDALPIRRVLAAVDFSERSAGVAELAQALAAEHRADVLVLHVLDTATGAPREPGEALVGVVARRVRDAGGRVETRLLAGDGGVAAAIAGAADAWSADLIVLGSRRLTDLGGLVLGSVAHDLTRQTRRPVLLAEEAPVTAAAPDAEARSGGPRRSGRATLERRPKRVTVDL